MCVISITVEMNVEFTDAISKKEVGDKREGAKDGALGHTRGDKEGLRLEGGVLWLQLNI